MDSDVLKLFGVMLSLTVAGGVGYAIIVLGNAMARRLGAGEKPTLPADTVADLEGRLAQLEDTTARLSELEERVDFVERRLVEGERSKARRLDG
jgi:hypothetical protein